MADVRVWAIEPGDGLTPSVTVGEAVTDAKGRFSLARLPDALARKSTALHLLARDRAGRVGFEFAHPLNLASRTIRLLPVADVRGRVVDRGGNPIAGLRVVPCHLTEPAHGSVGVALSPDVAAWHAAATDAAGAFRLRDIPAGGKVSAVIDSPRFGRPRITWDPKRPVKVALDDRLGSVQGQLSPRDGPGLSGTRVIAASSNGGFLGGDAHYEQFVERLCVVGPDGTFRCEELPPGRYDIEAVIRPEAPFDEGRLHGVEVGPGALRAGLELRLQRLPEITGRVVDAADGKGLAGVEVQFLVGQDPWSHSLIERATTDRAGGYRHHLRPGLVEVVPLRTTTHSGLRSDVWPRLKVESDRRWPDLKVARAAVVEGLAIDDDGRPAAGAEVFVIEPEGPLPGKGSAAVSRSDGSFRLEGLIPDASVSILARTAAAVTAVPVKLRPDRQAGRVRIIVEPAPAAHLTGTVKQRAGDPVAGATVSLEWTSDPSAGWTLLETSTTGPAGRFETGALWPGKRYRVRVLTDDQGESAPREVAAEAGRRSDIGTIELVQP